MTIHQAMDVLKNMLGEDDTEDAALSIAIRCMELVYEDAFIKG